MRSRKGYLWSPGGVNDETWDTSGYVQVVFATNAYGNSMKKGSCLTDSTAEFKPTSKNNQLSVHCFKKSMFKWLNKLECTETIVLKAKYKE